MQKHLWGIIYYEDLRKSAQEAILNMNAWSRNKIASNMILMCLETHSWNLLTLLKRFLIRKARSLELFLILPWKLRRQGVKKISPLLSLNFLGCIYSPFFNYYYYYYFFILQVFNIPPLFLLSFFLSYLFIYFFT